MSPGTASETYALASGMSSEAASVTYAVASGMSLCTTRLVPKSTAFTGPG